MTNVNGKRNLLIVSNRLPISVKKTSKGLEFLSSAGGLATGVFDLNKEINNTWIGWPGISSDVLTDDEKKQIIDELKKHNCHPVFLDQLQVESHYNGYCNRIVWPLLHNIDIAPSDLARQQEYWESYKDANQVFADAIDQIDPEGQSSVWIHDYHLWLLPSILRGRNKERKVGLFQHVPFPVSKRFLKLEQAEQLISELVAGADLIGFHTKKYVNNFINTCRQLSIGAIKGSKITYDNHISKVANFPMGIDYSKFKKLTESIEISNNEKRMKSSYHDKKVILAISRLDPIKGLVEKVLAYRKFLETRLDYHKRVTFIMIIVPSRTSIEQYIDLELRLIAEINSVNEEFGSEDWIPIEFNYQGQSINKLSALYKLADVALVTSIIDGMNLVAKEYVASRRLKAGVLILGNNVGAVEQLTEAILVNPHNYKQVADAIGQALDMPMEEQRERMQKMQENVACSTVYEWYNDFMNVLNQQNALDIMSDSDSKEQLLNSYKNSKSRVIFADYDGTLANLVDKPEEGVLSEDAKCSLINLAKDDSNTVVVISGRDRKSLDKFLVGIQVSVIAEHGGFYREPNGPWKATKYNTSIDDAWKDMAVDLIHLETDDIKDSFIEIKSTSVIWHYRGANEDFFNELVVSQVFDNIPEKIQARYGCVVQITHGKRIIEIRLGGIDKGKITKDLIQQRNPDFIMAIGDDVTDEDMFRSLYGINNAHTIKVGKDDTCAKYRVKKVSDVMKLLNILCAQK